jgi:uncharacterized protein
MFWRVVCIAGAVLAGAVAPALGQSPAPIPQPNEVLATQPAATVPAMEAPVAPPAQAIVIGPARKPGERFGGDDGVFRFVVIGDTLARGLGAGLERLTDLDPRFEVVNRFNEASGIARPQVYDWPSAISKILKASSFDAVIVAMGVNDRQPIKVGDVKVEYGTPEWSNAYKANVDALLAAIKSSGAHVHWVVLPPMQNPEFEAQMQIIASLQRERVALAGETLIDIRPPLTNPNGTFMIGDLDGKGKARRLRTKDGINFSRVGNDVLAGLVMGGMRKAENIPELQATGEDENPAEVQVAVAAPVTASPIFGQSGVDGVDLTFEAEALAKEVPQKLAPDLSNAGKLGLKIARNSLAQRFYRTGEALGVPFGRFDDFSYSPPPGAN